MALRRALKTFDDSPDKFRVFSTLYEAYVVEVRCAELVHEHQIGKAKMAAGSATPEVPAFAGFHPNRSWSSDGERKYWVACTHLKGNERKHWARAACVDNYRRRVIREGELIRAK